MSERVNRFGQPVGASVDGWRERPRPPRTTMTGRYCTLEPLVADVHAAPLLAAYEQYENGSSWTYLPYGPFDSVEDYAAWIRPMEASLDPVPFAIVAGEGAAPIGVASYLRVNPEHGSIEVGHVHYSPALRKTPAATEAMYLMMRRAFDELGYRRYEWKCDSCNAPSRAAAERLGFSYEGTFRNALVMKGRNRDTSWFSITAEEWPRVKSALAAWLDPSNFELGRQKQSLGDLMEAS